MGRTLASKSSLRFSVFVFNRFVKVSFRCWSPLDSVFSRSIWVSKRLRVSGMLGKVTVLWITKSCFSRIASFFPVRVMVLTEANVQIISININLLMSRVSDILTVNDCYAVIGSVLGNEVTRYASLPWVSFALCSGFESKKC